MVDARFSSTRRTVVASVAGAGLLAAAGRVAAAPGAKGRGAAAFPEGFRWGCATAGHQIEGNNVNSDLWVMEQVKPATFVEPSGDACDSLHRYPEDIALLASLGLNTYRFSIEWSRIEPERGQFSNAYLDHYKRMIETCHKHGVQPAVSFNHGSAPRWFAAAGGWLNPESPAWFAAYCARAAKEMAGGMGYAFTLNEPQVSKGYGMLTGGARRRGGMGEPGARPTADEDKTLAAFAAAAKAVGSDRFVTISYPDIDGMTPQLIAAHEQGYAAIKAERSNLPVSVTMNIIDFQPIAPGSAAEKLREAAYGEWMDVVRRSADFVAVQAYRQIVIPGDGKPPTPPAPLPGVDPKDMMTNLFQPIVLRHAVEWAHARTGKPVFVSENGIDTENDALRIWHIDHTLKELQASIAAGTPVIGYLHWSLLDNFEWNRGYKPKYGLYAVDRTTFKRTAKPSAAHLGAIARRNAV